VKLVIDTNVLLISLPRISPYRPIFDSLLNGDFELIISEAIFQEYIEIIGQKTNQQIARNISELLTQLDNVELHQIYFRWNLIIEDPDDNKFVDCAVASNAKYIVTNDKHFNVLKYIDFPKLEVKNADEFLKEVKDKEK
jgi:putative PIN family toxin of toxin-antitoxin system